MYSYEERIRAVKLYIKLGKRTVHLFAESRTTGHLRRRSAKIRPELRYSVFLSRSQL